RFTTGRIQLFGAATLGVTYSKIGEDRFVLGEIEPAIGLVVGFEVGARFRIGQRASFEASLGFVRHSAEHEIDTVVGSAAVAGTITDMLLKVDACFDLSPHSWCRRATWQSRAGA